MHLTLLIPELLWSEPGDTEANAPALQSSLANILAQRHFSKKANTGWETSLLALTGFDPDSSIASLRALGEVSPPAPEPTSNAPQWLCADPVHLRFHQDRLILADGQELGLTMADLEALATRLNETFSGRARFHFTNPTRGYLQLAGAKSRADSAGQALSLKIGCEVKPGDFGQSPEIRGLANEIQMFLHADPLNSARAARGLPVLNALWLWGAGETPKLGKPPKAVAESPAVDALSGSHPLLLGIAKAMTTLGRPMALVSYRLNQDSVSALAEIKATQAKHALCLVDALNSPTHYQNSNDYAGAWRSIDHALLTPSVRALRRWQLNRLHVFAPVVFGELHWHLSPLSAWKNPLSRRNWPGLIGELATPE